MKLIAVFINAWWIAVKISFNKDMECLNNPTPDVVYDSVVLRSKLRRLQAWSSKRWGAERVAKLIFEKEHGA